MSIRKGGPKPTILSNDLYKFITSERLLSPKDFKLMIHFLRAKKYKTLNIEYK